MTLAKKVDAAAVAVPKIQGQLKPGTYNYDAKIAVGGQNMALKLSTEIKEEDGGWAITDTMQTPMGPATDSVVLDKSTLALKKRSVKQGPVAINVAFADNKASGSMSMNGKEQPIDADLGGALFADAAGAHQVTSERSRWPPATRRASETSTCRSVRPR